MYTNEFRNQDFSGLMSLVKFLNSYAEMRLKNRQKFAQKYSQGRICYNIKNRQWLGMLVQDVAILKSLCEKLSN